MRKATRNLRGQGPSRKGQGATEYLVILGAVLLVSIVVVSATSSITSSQSSVKQQQSQAYWSSLSPIKVLSSKVVDSNLVLGIQNAGSSTIRIDGIRVGNSSLPIYPYYSGDSYGPAYCLRPNDNFSEPSMSCALMVGPGETAYVAAQGAISGSSPAIDCAGKSSTEISAVQFEYSVGSSGVTNLVLKGDKPMLASCGSKACDENWVKVPGNSSFLVNDFCLMAYEARNNSDGVAVSQSDGTIWAHVNWFDAKANCSALGSGYHLIRDREWIVVVNNVANVAANWNTNVIGSGSLKVGNNGVNSSVSYDGPEPDTGTSNSTSVLFLSTEQAIWHFSGNMWEWTDGVIISSACDAPMPKPCNGIIQYNLVTDFSSINYSRPPNPAWTSTQGIGRISIDANNASNGTFAIFDTHTFLRGGAWNSNTYAGAWALYTQYAPGYIDSNVGFRCAR